MPFVEAGYLFLAATDTGATVLQENHAVQAALDAPVALCQPDELSRRFPWLNVEDVKLGSLGLLGPGERAEGFLDPYLLTTALNKSARRQGVEQVCALLRCFRCRQIVVGECFGAGVGGGGGVEGGDGSDGRGWREGDGGDGEGGGGGGETAGAPTPAPPLLYRQP